MMCVCDEERGKRFLPHQLMSGTRLESQERIPVTLGFVACVCNECRGLPAEAHPVASTPGRTSKIKRYYWRELAFREYELFEEYGGKPENYIYEIGEIETDTIRRAREQALVDIKKQHRANPKYSYQEESTDSVISRYCVSVRNVYAEYVQSGERKLKINHDGRLISVEEFAETIYRSLGYDVLFLESIPFHVVFSVFTWLVIQDPHDPNVRMSGFGERSTYEENRSKKPIWVALPSDFGTSGYAERRSVQIGSHFEALLEVKDDLPWLFEYWLPYSEGLRQYLWAHREEHISKARKIIEILEPLTILKIVRCLLNNYWKRYLGWPDLLVFNAAEYLFVEVKSSKDKLSEEQKHWIEMNNDELNLPFEILKIHRASNPRG
jgi:VRR-NUC domain